MASDAFNAGTADYPADAGHAFVFQEGTPFTFAIESFLTGSPQPLSICGMRAQFLAGEAAAIPAGTTWAAKLKALPPGPAAAQVAMIDQSWASTLIKFDDQLLSFGATGSGPGRPRRRGTPRSPRLPPRRCARPSGFRPAGRG